MHLDHGSALTLRRRSVIVAAYVAAAIAALIAAAPSRSAAAPSFECNQKACVGPTKCDRWMNAHCRETFFPLGCESFVCRRGPGEEM